ncbi:MAG: class B sortase [Lachnospiraceae bacterium]|nr:class B sortase [Lachnospiraceae bacterium]
MKEKILGNKKIMAVIITLLVIILVVCIFVVARYLKNKNKMEEVKKTVPVTEETIDVSIDWDKLHEVNKDIYAWILIPGTKVNYPIVQSDEYTDTDYYLDHNLDDSKGLPGCIYTQQVNSKDFTDPCTVIYGHNMRDDSMFGSLHDYEDREFFDKNQYIYIYTEDGVMVYRIYAAVQEDDSLILQSHGLFQDKNVFADYISSILGETENDSTKHINKDVMVDADKTIIVLSTCTSNDNYRYLIQAVRLTDDEIKTMDPQSLINSKNLAAEAASASFLSGDEENASE